MLCNLDSILSFSACYHRDTCAIGDDIDNPKILHGALVGGVDSTDSFTDTRDDSKHNGVAVDQNAGFQGALAGS